MLLTGLHLQHYASAKCQLIRDMQRCSLDQRHHAQRPIAQTCASPFTDTVGNRSQPRTASIRARCTAASRLMDTSQWAEKLRKRAHEDIISAGVRTKAGSKEDMEQSLMDFEALLPGVIPNLEALSAAKWAAVVSDSSGLGMKVLLLKEAFPRLDLQLLTTTYPKVLTWPVAQMRDNVEKVRTLLAPCPRPELILAVLPEILDPKQAISVVVTLRKWFPKRDPLDKLQEDPEVIRRAEKCDVPLEPVFLDSATGAWSAASYSRDNRQPWQEYLDRVVYKRPEDVEAHKKASGQGDSPSSSEAARPQSSTIMEAVYSTVALDTRSGSGVAAGTAKGSASDGDVDRSAAAGGVGASSSSSRAASSKGRDSGLNDYYMPWQ